MTMLQGCTNDGSHKELVVDLELSMRDVLVEVITDFFRTRESNGQQEQQHAPPSSLIGVASLAHPDFKIEVEASAVISTTTG